MAYSLRTDHAKHIRIRRNITHVDHRRRRPTASHALWREQPKYVSIKRALKPEEGPISGTALLIDGGRYFCYIRYNAEVVELLGRYLPYGVSYYKPAYLKVVWRPLHKVYDVLCSYLDNSHTILLWQTPKLPSWVWHPKLGEEYARGRRIHVRND
jgi:hypothetical protein